jgi:hypothetical protein
MCALAISSGARAGEVDDFPYILESKIPMFSFETPVKLQVKVFDRARREVRNATVIYEITVAAGPPPMGHDKEMAYYDKITRGDTSDPEVKRYIEYLSHMKLAQAKSLQKRATYDASGYYSATQVFDKFPWGISVYVGEPGGRLYKTPYHYPHRAHCEYADVTNYELVKTHLHQLAAAAKKGQWTDAEKQLAMIHASVHGFHGHHFTTVTHHTQPPIAVDQEVQRLQQSVAQKSSKAVFESVAGVLVILEKAEGYFATIDVKKVGAGSAVTQTQAATSYEIEVRDNINKKGITNAIVVVDENYNLDATLTSPTILPILTPDPTGVYKALYHAKMAYLPQGTMAREMGDGRYRFESKGFDSVKNPKRIFVYYGFASAPGIPGKFVSKEINLPYSTAPAHAEKSLQPVHLVSDAAAIPAEAQKSHNHVHQPSDATR